MFYIVALSLGVVFLEDRALKQFSVALVVWLIIVSSLSLPIYALGLDYFLGNTISLLIMCALTTYLRPLQRGVLVGAYLTVAGYSYLCYEHSYVQLLWYYPYVLEGVLLVTFNVIGFSIKGKKNNIIFALSTLTLFMIIPRTL